MTLALRSRWNLQHVSSLGAYATLAEAAALLVCSRLAIRLCFPAAAPWLFRSRHTDDPRPDPELELLLGRSVEAVIRVFRWKDCCLPAAMTVKVMLARRGFSSTVHLGAGHAPSGSLHAHAWIEAGGDIITGEHFLHTVTPIVRELRP